MFDKNFLAKSLIKKINSTQTKELNSDNLDVTTNLISLYEEKLKDKNKNFSLSDEEINKITKYNFKTSDGVKISAISYIKNPNSNKWIISMHGYQSRKESMLFTSLHLSELDYNLFLFDFRNHGDSGESIVTFGLNEQKDLIAALDFLKERYNPTEVGLVGASMGAFTLNYFALSNLDYDKYNIKFGISDSSFYSLENVLYKKLIAESPLMKNFVEQISNEIISVYKDDYNVDLNNVNLENINLPNKSSFPILIIHSKSDLIVDYNDANKIFELRKNKNIKNDEVILFSVGAHVKSLIENFNDYTAGVKKFIKKISSGANNE